MDEIAAQYYPPQPPPPAGTQYQYYQPPPPPPPGAPAAPPPYYNHHHHNIPQQPPPPAFYAPAPVYQTASYQDEVRTLFVAGLPDDVKAREIYNLFREFPGYESSHLRNQSENQSPFGFAVFVDQPSALAALHALNGMVFDLEKGSTLFVDLAKSNSRSKRSRTDDGRHGSEKRMKGSAAFSRGYSDTGVGSVHMPGMVIPAYNMIGYPSAQSYGNFDGGAEITTAASKSRNSSAPPCPTLFVANLGPSCSEEELIQVFSRCRGYLKLKMQSTYGTPVAFVDFKDTASSSEALNHLQGTILYSSLTGEGMRLEYAKSRMGMRSKKSR